MFFCYVHFCYIKTKTKSKYYDIVRYIIFCEYLRWNRDRIFLQWLRDCFSKEYKFHQIFNKIFNKNEIKIAIINKSYSSTRNMRSSISLKGRCSYKFSSLTNAVRCTKILMSLHKLIKNLGNKNKISMTREAYYNSVMARKITTP